MSDQTLSLLELDTRDLTATQLGQIKKSLQSQGDTVFNEVQSAFTLLTSIRQLVNTDPAFAATKTIDLADVDAVIAQQKQMVTDMYQKIATLLGITK